MVTAIIETTVLVDLLRGYRPALNWLHTQSSADLGITPVIAMEVISGGQNKIKRLQATRLLRRFQTIHLTPADQDWAVAMQLRYELSHGVGKMDCLIASVNHRLQIPLYTHNLKHFAPLLGPLAQKPY
jgi:predicted nucleic acid-binding protein